MKYTKEFLQPIVVECRSVAEVMKRLGLKPIGGNHTYMKKRLGDLNIDCTHFLGQSSNRGKEPCNKKSWPEILVKRNSHYKENAARLRRALVEYGKSYNCEICDIGGVWRDKELILQVDHKNGDSLDNSPDNLRFLCPNCHSQTDNWGFKG